eukprot:m.48542 g.48542  ORF g.48542 m.48542 type:complete len:490 (-) comp10571_c0_seq1:119-1588(-)
MSLADELLADLEEIDDGDNGAMEPIPEEDEGEEEEQDLDTEDLKHDNIHAIAKLSESEELTGVLASIDKYTAERETRSAVSGPVEEDPEYKLIVEANNLTLEVDNEIGIIHKFLRDKYGKRFPELEQLVLHPLDYFRTVKTMQNQMDCTQLNLTEILAPATIMIVSVTASTTQGKTLDEEELARVLEAADMGLALNDAKNKIFDYVESRMYFLSPNLTHICGANTAAKMMGAAGGLTTLSSMPACNILLLGAQKRALAGFSAAAMLPNTGFLFYCDIVQSQPPELRRKAARLVAGKCALAARVDSYHDGNVTGATVGITMRKDIEKKLEKALEPPPAKVSKALPKPDGEHKKKRGGKRVRKMKERYSMSEARKASNRVGFGELGEDIYQTEMGFSLGSLGKEGSHGGHFRVQESNKRKAGTITKKMAKRLAQRQNRGGLTTVGPTSGTASVAFTPVQGLEINRSDARKKVAEANKKYFGNKSFQSVKQT